MRREGEPAQIMLLSAVLLVIGFVALGSMLSRVDLATSRTSQAQESPLILESGQVAQAVDALIVGLQEDWNVTAHGYAVGDPDFYDLLEDGLGQLAAMETAQGLPMEFQLLCDPAGASTGSVEVTLMSPDTVIQFESSATWSPCT